MQHENPTYKPSQPESSDMQLRKELMFLERETEKPSEKDVKECYRVHNE